MRVCLHSIILLCIHSGFNLVEGVWKGGVVTDLWMGSGGRSGSSELGVRYNGPSLGVVGLLGAGRPRGRSGSSELGGPTSADQAGCS